MNMAEMDLGWNDMGWNGLGWHKLQWHDVGWHDMDWNECGVNERGPVVNFFENNSFKSSLENEMVLVVRAVKCGNIAAEEMSGV